MLFPFNSIWSSFVIRRPSAVISLQGKHKKIIIQEKEIDEHSFQNEKEFQPLLI